MTQNFPFAYEQWIHFKNHNEFIGPLTTNVQFHIETGQLICSANQLTGLYDGEHWSLMGYPNYEGKLQASQLIT